MERNIFSRKILNKYKLLQLQHWNLKLIDVNCLEQPRNYHWYHGKREKRMIHSVQEFFYRDDVSMALPGKRDAKKVGKNLLLRHLLNNYFSNLCNKFIAENPSTKLTFSKFTRMWLSHFKHVNFATRQSCLCTIKAQNPQRFENCNYNKPWRFCEKPQWSWHYSENYKPCLWENFFSGMEKCGSGNKK